MDRVTPNLLQNYKKVAIISTLRANYYDFMSIFRISAPDGVFMVVGNHEYISGIDAVERFVDKTDITLLRDSVARVGEIASWW